MTEWTPEEQAGPPATIREMLELLVSLDAWMKSVDRQIHGLAANVDLLCLSYQDAVKEINLIRSKLLRCPPHCPYLAVEKHNVPTDG